MALLAELKRRNVIRVAVAYAAVAWLLIQIVETLFPIFALSPTSIRVVVILLAVGFIPVVLLAWYFELTPDGFARDSDVDRSLPSSRHMTRLLDRGVIVVLTLAVVFLLVDKFVLQGSPQDAAVKGKSIAVLPFADMSPEGDQAYLADGIAEELLNLLAKTRGLQVTSRSSSFALRNDDLGLTEIADKLNVVYVLEGSVRKAGDKIRVTAQLIDARSDKHMWSETYDRMLDDVFVIQDEISLSVARELKVRLLGPAEASDSTSMAAYETYLRGLSLLARRGPENLTGAVDLFEQVTDADPQYAPAFASLALGLLWSDWFTPDALERGDIAANRALELDPGNSDALTALGYVWGEHGQIDMSRDAFRRAVEQNPNNAMAFRWLARSFVDTDPQRYYSLVRRAYLVDPLDPSIHFHLVQSSMALGRFGEALALARETPVQPYEMTGHFLAIGIHQAEGRLDRALKTGYHHYRAKQNAWTYGPMLWTLLNLGELELARTWLGELKRQTGIPYIEPVEGVLVATTGDVDQAVQLEIAAAERGQTDDPGLGFFVMTISRNFVRARQLYERHFSDRALDPRSFKDSDWNLHIDYALLLQRTGEPQAAETLIHDARAMLIAQLADGVAIKQGLPVRFYLAALDAMSGRTEEAVSQLREAVQAGFVGMGALRNYPHFDSIRDEPGFIGVITELNAIIGAQRKLLDEEGMLLTPEQVLALESFDFDPFGR